MSYAFEDGSNTAVNAGSASATISSAPAVPVAARPAELADFFGEIGANGQPRPIEDGFDRQSESAFYVIGKRCLDIVGSVVGLIVLGPIILLSLLAVFLHDRRNPLFIQDRVGMHGKIFKIMKVRSMCVDAEQKFEEVKHLNHHGDHRTFKTEADPRVIPLIGERLRRYSLDEFPQLINVLKGDMSLVGPRPALPHEVSSYSDRDLQRLAVKPGLTCLWQVNGRGNLGFEEQLELDLKYIRESSLMMDLTLIAKTIPALLTGHGAH